MERLAGRRPVRRNHGTSAARRGILTLSASVIAALTAPLAAPGARAAAGAGGGAWLEVLQGIHPYAAVTWTHDSNLLRRPDGGGDKSDDYLTLEAGLDTELIFSRQVVTIDGRIFRNHYDRFDAFDYTGGDARVVWNWLWGRLWDGEVGYTFARKQRDFANQLVPIKDIQNRHGVYLSANRALTTRWRAGAQLEWADIGYSETDSLDKSRYGVVGRLEYVSPADNSVGFQVGYSPAHYANRDDADYDDLWIGMNTRWQITGKTRLQAEAGYKTRAYDNANERDFDGLVGRVKAIWRASGKTTVAATLWRDISNLGDEVPNYAVVDGLSLEPRWQMTAKTALGLVASYEWRDFERAPLEGSSSLPERDDEVGALGLKIDWEPRRNIAFSLGFHVESRDSSDPLWEYDDQYVQARLSVGL